MNPNSIKRVALPLLVTGIASVPLPPQAFAALTVAEISARSPQRRSVVRPTVTRPALSPTSNPDRPRRNPRQFQPRSRQTTRIPNRSQRQPQSRRHRRQTNARLTRNQLRPSAPRPTRSRLTLTKQLPFAQYPGQYSKQLSCDDPQTQQALNRCAFQTFSQANRQLNTTYRRLLPNLSEQRRRLLREAQQAWVTYRDRECRFYDSSAEGGSLQPLLRSGCKTRLTRDRIQQLDRYRTGKSSPVIPEGDRISEQRLQERYQQVRAWVGGSSGRRSPLLRNAEQAWQHYRNQTCQFEASGGGNAANSACRQWHLNRRYSQLGDYLD